VRVCIAAEEEAIIREAESALQHKPAAMVY
jgi:hypothetical protein